MSNDAHPHITPLLTLLTLTLLTLGCQTKPPALPGDNLQPPCASDRLAASVRRTGDGSSLPAQRPWPTRIRYYHNVAVAHPQHYLEGPYENPSEDGCFRTWNAQHALALPVSPLIFLKNVITSPAALAFNPPWHTYPSRAALDPVQPTFSLPSHNSAAAQNEPWYRTTTDEPDMLITLPD